MILADAPLMRAQQPTLEQRNDAMHPWQQMFRPDGLVFLDLACMHIAFQFTVSLQAVGCNRATWFDGLLDKSMQGCPGGVGNMSPRCLRLQPRRPP